MSRGISPRFQSCFGHGERFSQVFEGADVGSGLCRSFVALFEMGYDATGAVLLAGVDRHFPLLRPFCFDPALAEQVAHLGESGVEVGPAPTTPASGDIISALTAPHAN